MLGVHGARFASFRVHPFAGRSSFSIKTAMRPQAVSRGDSEQHGMELGIFDTFSPDQSADLATAYEAHIADARTAEQLGYKYYFFIEHQNARYPVVSAPSVFLTALARATTTLRIGAMVFQLPMHHPVRLAQDVAMIDQLSHGRMEFAIGYGTQAREFDPWRLDYGKRREVGVEVMDVVLKAWAGSPFTHDGEHFHFDGAMPQPLPYQQPRPPVWMGGHSPASIAYAAERNFDFAQNMDVDRTIAAKFEAFRSAWKTHDHAGRRPRTLLVRHVHVAATDAQARAEAEPFMLEGLTGQAGVARALALREDEKTAEMLEIARIYIESSKSYDFWIDEGLAFVGTPETVAGQIVAQQALCGYDILLTHHQITSMPYVLAQASMRLFGERVIPLLTG
jgi:alkanesulfonate monooxygenase SsuD/methylene tetrahydromethanopterin reductase-like flavin-dependent oxidoreductase (luciferase family)